MKIADAKLIPVEKLVEYFGGHYSHTDRHGDLWYFSPFRPEEGTASFKINVKLNRWHDFGMSKTFAHQSQGSGGDILDLWCDFNFKDRRSGVNEARQALEMFNTTGKASYERKMILQTVKPPVKKPRYKILRINNNITSPGLKDELQRRRISLKLANEYLKQGEILDTETNVKYIGFLFENDNMGYEVSIPNPKKGECFKTCIGSKASTRLLQDDTVNSADVFEGFWDFLSWLEFNKLPVPKNHTYILNSTSLVSEACQKIIDYKETVVYVFLFMDNDEAGYQATHAIAANLEEHDIKVGSWEQFYRGYKDLSKFWMDNPEAKKLKPI